MKFWMKPQLSIPLRYKDQSESSWALEASGPILHVVGSCEFKDSITCTPPYQPEVKKSTKETGLGSAHNTVIWTFLSLEQYKIIQWPLSWSRILDAWESGILLGYGKLTADTINKWISVKYADFFGRNFMNTRFKTSYTISNAITNTNKGWMASPTQWAWVWANSGSWWWTGRPGVLESIGWQTVGHDWATELNWRVLWTEGGVGEDSWESPGLQDQTSQS